MSLNSNRDDVVAEISKIIGEQKGEVASNVKQAIYEYVSNQTFQECLSLVLRDPDGKLISQIPFSIRRRYAAVLIAFLRKKPFEGYAIDSALTDPIIEIVAKIFSENLGGKIAKSTDKLIPLLIADGQFIDSLTDTLVEMMRGSIPNEIKKRISAILSAKIKTAIVQKINTTTLSSVKSSIAQISITLLSTPAAIKLASAIAGSVIILLGPLVIKIMASAAFKLALIKFLKPLIIGIILTGIIKLVAAKIGLSIAGTTTIVMLPVLSAWIYYEFKRFPKKLARNLSKSVAAYISGKFDKTSAPVARILVDRLLREGVSLIASELVKDQEIRDAINQIIDEHDKQ